MNKKQLERTLTDPNYLFQGIVKKLSPLINDDKQYLSLLYWACCGKRINWDEPRLFSEKMQWLKLYNRNPEYVIMADKVKAKEWVAERIGQEYIIPTLGVWERAEDVDFDLLPDKFVIKCNHNSGTGMYICKDKSRMDVNKVRIGLQKGLRENYFSRGREWPYKDIPRRIIAEQYIEDCTHPGDLSDYKFFCFNGEPVFCQVIGDRSKKMVVDFFDMNWNHQSFHEPKDTEFASYLVPKPCNFDKMLKIVQNLACKMPFSRIDLYNLNGTLFFGEITFFPTSGLGGFDPSDWDEKFGELLDITNV